MVAQGTDPAEERRGLAKDLTFRLFSQQYLEHAKERKKKSVRDDEGRLRWLKDLMALPVRSISKRDVERVQSRM